MNAPDRDTESSAVRVPKAAELVAASIRRQIVRGKLVEGDTLPRESTLMERFGVSRPTLREAFRVLESESLISVRRGARGGARVHTPDGAMAARYAGLVLQFQATTLVDVYEARRAIELAAVAALAKNAEREALEPLRENLACLQDQNGDPASSIHLLENFHRLMVDAAGNQTLSMFEAMIHHILDLHGAADSANWSGTPEEHSEATAAARTHHQLVELLADNAADDAVELWGRHLDQGSERVLRGVDAKTVLELLA